MMLLLLMMILLLMSCRFVYSVNFKPAPTATRPAATLIATEGARPQLARPQPPTCKANRHNNISNCETVTTRKANDHNCKAKGRNDNSNGKRPQLTTNSSSDRCHAAELVVVVATKSSGAAHCDVASRAQLEVLPGMHGQGWWCHCFSHPPHRCCARHATPPVAQHEHPLAVMQGATPRCLYGCTY